MITKEPLIVGNALKKYRKRQFKDKGKYFVRRIVQIIISNKEHYN